MAAKRGAWNGIAHSVANHYRREGYHGTVYYRQSTANWSPTGLAEHERAYQWDVYGFRVNDSTTDELEPIGAQYLFRSRWRRVDRVLPFIGDPAEMGEFFPLVSSLISHVQRGGYRFFARLNIQLESTVYDEEDEPETVLQWLHLTATLRLNQLLSVSTNRWQELLELTESKQGKISDLSAYDGIRAVELRVSTSSTEV